MVIKRVNRSEKFAMKAMVLKKPASIESNPLVLKELKIPELKEDEVLVKVLACGVCRTDLHIVEGELPSQKLPLIPGHQIVGKIEDAGCKVRKFTKGEIVGIPWLHYSCGRCKYCRKGLQNLCENILFTGYHVDGGYAEFVVAKETAIYRIPSCADPVNFAPVLCGGVIGYRALKLTKLKSGESLGIVGFGSSAHIVLQIATYMGIEVYVFSRTGLHRQMARKLGAKWTGELGDKIDAKLGGVIVFAPAGWTMIEALKYVDRGGSVVSAGIYMSEIPSFSYDLLYEERQMLSTANSTPQDVEETIKLATEIPLKAEVEIYKLEDANFALQKMKNSQIQGSAVLVID